MSDRVTNLKKQFFGHCWGYYARQRILYPPLHWDFTNQDPSPYRSAFRDFYGLPSNPKSIYKTGDEWPRPVGHAQQRVPREARPICNHPIQDAWPTLGKQVYEFLDSLNVKWTTIDPLRFALEEGGEAGPLHLWIGVEPQTLSFEDAQVAAVGCKSILANFPDIEIAFRESVYISSVGPQLLNHVNTQDPLSDIRSPFTPALSIQIASRDSPHLEGSGALYFRESSESEEVLLLTARHVVLPQSVYTNEVYKHRSKTNRPQEVLMFGSNAYAHVLGDIMMEIANHMGSIPMYTYNLKDLGEATEGESPKKAVMRQIYQDKLNKATAAFPAADKLHDEISKYWATPSQRVLGYVLYSPPISLSTGPEQFTVDWALVHINRDRIDWSDFKGNVIYLGNRISIEGYIGKMYPHHQDHPADLPFGGFLEINGFLGEDEIRKPKQLDANGEECLIVIKNGLRTGITVGRGSSIMSFVRKYDEHGMKLTSMEIPIYSYNYENRVFSAAGDSGSIVVDRSGRIVGLLTGGAGKPEDIDVTYLTPYYWIEKEIKKVFPDSFLYTV